MAHIVEISKSGRARCRTCGEGIAKGDHRFGEEVANAFSAEGGTSYNFHHLRCAAKKKPFELRETLKTFVGDVPEREEIDRLIAEYEPKQKPSTFPYAEKAPSNRSHCGECHTVIAKGALRVAIKREDDGGPGPMGGAPAPRYLHVACAKAAAKDDVAGFVAAIKRHSRGLSGDDVAELDRAFA